LAGQDARRPRSRRAAAAALDEPPAAAGAGCVLHQGGRGRAGARRGAERGDVVLCDLGCLGQKVPAMPGTYRRRAMEMEIASGKLSMEDYLRAIAQCIGFLSKAGVASTMVAFGFGCDCPDEELYQDVLMPLHRLPEFIR